MTMSDRPNCPTCDFRMIHVPRPLQQIFGDVRAFQCQPCDFMVLLPPRKISDVGLMRLSNGPGTGLDFASPASQTGNLLRPR